MEDIAQIFCRFRFEVHNRFQCRFLSFGLLSKRYLYYNGLQAFLQEKAPIPTGKTGENGSLLLKNLCTLPLRFVSFFGMTDDLQAGKFLPLLFLQRIGDKGRRGLKVRNNDCLLYTSSLETSFNT